MVSGAHFDPESLSVPKHFVEQFKPGKVFCSFIRLGCGCSAVKPDERKRNCQDWPTARPGERERERNCHAKTRPTFPN
jgi:hypothetical protein